MALSQTQDSATLLAFPRNASSLRTDLAAALKRHRLPELLAASILREAASLPASDIRTALTSVLTRRLVQAPLDLQGARGILLLGPSGAGKSAVAAKIVHAARLMGRDTDCTAASDGLAHFRTGTAPAGRLMVMEAQGFNPLNLRAASAFAALGEAPGVQTIGVVSALSDAEDVADIVASFRLRRVIVTHLDRTRRLGALLAACAGGARLAHVTAGPREDDALDTLDGDALSALLLETH